MGRGLSRVAEHHRIRPSGSQCRAVRFNLADITFVQYVLWALCSLAARCRRRRASRAAACWLPSTSSSVTRTRRRASCGRSPSPRWRTSSASPSTPRRRRTASSYVPPDTRLRCRGGEGKGRGRDSMAGGVQRFRADSLEGLAGQTLNLCLHFVFYIV